MNRYFVKFVPYNERTITHLVNKTVKFSTVFEFNDLNEYRYLSTPYRAEQCDQDKQTKKLMAKIKKNHMFHLSIKIYSNWQWKQEHQDVKILLKTF